MMRVKECSGSGQRAASGNTAQSSGVEVPTVKSWMFSKKRNAAGGGIRGGTGVIISGMRRPQMNTAVRIAITMMSAMAMTEKEGIVGHSTARGLAAEMRRTEAASIAGRTRRQIARRGVLRGLLSPRDILFGVSAGHAFQREVEAALVINVSDHDRDAVADVHHVLHRADAPGGKFGDVDEAIGFRRNLDHRAEVEDADDGSFEDRKSV